jgi:hypothetical protein
MPFKKGDKNINKKGRPRKGMSFKDEIRAQADELLMQGDLNTLQALVRVLFKKAGSGDLKAIEMLMDRLDGKPTQRVDANVKQISVVIDQADADAVL